MITPENLGALHLTRRRRARLAELLEFFHFFRCQNQFRTFGFSCHITNIAGNSQYVHLLMKRDTSRCPRASRVGFVLKGGRQF